jgi:hypothetical protein
MRDDLPDWLDDDRTPPSPRRRTTLIVLAVLPWLVVLWALVSPRLSPLPVGEEDRTQDRSDAATAAADRDRGDDESTPGAAAATGPEVARRGADEAGAPGNATDPIEPGWWLTEHRGDWRLGPGEGVMASVAVVVARAWLTGLPPRLEVAGIVPTGEEGYVEHLTVEAIERPEAGAAVVTLLAVLLEVGEEQTAHVRRLAVPLVEEPGGPRPAGSPWWLPAPDLSAVPVDTEPVDDPELLAAAAAAVDGAGLGHLEVVALERTIRWPWVARVRGEGSGAAGGATTDGAVWLRRHLDGFALAGVPLPHLPPGSAAPAASTTAPHGDDEEVEP